MSVLTYLWCNCVGFGLGQESQHHVRHLLQETSDTHSCYIDCYNYHVCVSFSVFVAQMSRFGICVSAGCGIVAPCLVFEVVNLTCYKSAATYFCVLFFRIEGVKMYVF